MMSIGYYAKYDVCIVEDGLTLLQKYLSVAGKTG